ncbi:MAG TPA: hypothetical protein VJT31_17110 [Rugosimonospora sp.]|nr:hypothetical protein [Rugosimonospora sp.]
MASAKETTAILVPARMASNSARVPVVAIPEYVLDLAFGEFDNWGTYQYPLPGAMGASAAAETEGS